MSLNSRPSFGSHSDKFPSPFFDAASLSMPETITSVFDWCSHIWYAAGQYRSAMERVLAYFMTDIDISGIGDELGDDELDKWNEYMSGTLDVLSLLGSMCRDRLCYGNSFCTPVVPFKRFLACKKCHVQVSHDEFVRNPEFNFSWSNLAYQGHCPSCGYSGEWSMHDMAGNMERELKFKTWPPQEIKIVFDLHSGNKSYWWKLPQQYIADIKAGKLMAIKHATKNVLQCVRDNVDLEFDSAQIFHMMEPTISGVNVAGWGIPRTMWHFRQIWYVQLLHRYNEAIAMDYVIPFRIITPKQQSTGDPFNGGMGQNGGDFVASIAKMRRMRRADPTSLNVLPFPVEYQVLGGEAKNLAPADLMAQGVDDLLTSAQVPVDLFKGSLALQNTPGALRMFEASWYPLLHDMDSFLRWLVGRVSGLLAWEDVTCSLARPRHADDMSRQMAMLQLMSGQAISQTTGLNTMGLDFRKEQRIIADESMFQQREQARMQRESEHGAFAAEMAQGGPAPAAAPSTAGMGTAPATGATGQTAQQVAGAPMMIPVEVPTTPDEMLSTADAVAQELLGQSESIKRQKLQEWKAKSEVMYSYIKEKMRQTRQQASSQGQSMVMQQQFGRP